METKRIRATLACLYFFLFGTTNIYSENLKEIKTYQNPIISGFNPDPSICRVEEDYYLVTSSFEFFPGVPIYHSRDLINWEKIGHVLDRPSQLNLDSTNCSGGIYAPTIRYNKGIFYMITTLITNPRKGFNSGNFVVTATKPEGPWSEPHWIEGAPGIDPSLFFDDDGKVYYQGNCKSQRPMFNAQRNIWVQQLDINTWKLVGQRIEVLDGAQFYKTGKLDGGIDSGVNNYESPHLYKKNGKYYLMISHGGTAQYHAVSIWRSDNVFGPYEINPANPILTNRFLPCDNSITSTGHADFVQTQNGDWWVVYLAKRPSGGCFHVLGRETFMSSVDWSGNWPIINPQGKSGISEISNQRPSLTEFVPQVASTKDEFDSDVLGKAWTFIRTPRSEWWSTKERKGFLRLHLRSETIEDQSNPSFVGMRQNSMSLKVSTKISFTPKYENEEAGLMVVRDKTNYFKFTVSKKDTEKRICLSSKQGEFCLENILSESIKTANPICLKISADGLLYSFYYSTNCIDWTTLKENVDGRFLGIENNSFTGTFVGLYGSSNGSISKNYADFDFFELTAR